ncbi:MAG TPA: metallophosphoesterase [Desulfomicrobiaceae bacterium]|nr:metallophosphoesterase [Desulfomicrobiaceae bacterium]
MTVTGAAQILILLLGINIAPVLVAFCLGSRWNRALDHGYTLRDGNPVFGPHKTIRGVLAALLAGTAGGAALGLPVSAGLATGGLTVLGDLLSSYVKRRRTLPSGTDVPVLDQGFEGALPLLYLSSHLGFGPVTFVLLLTLFSAGAYVGSVLYKKMLPGIHPEASPRRSRSLFREYTSCTVQSRFWTSLFNFEEAVYYHVLIKTAFKWSGLLPRGMANALAFTIREIPVSDPALPAAFDGYRILFMSDLHLDGLNGLPERLCGLLPSLEADLCLLGGDYRMASYGSFNGARERLARIVPYITARDGIAAVLGNHDCVEVLETFMKLGVVPLVNDSMEVARGADRIWLAGVDDPHSFKAHDPDMAFADIPAGAWTIFLGHSPEVYHEAWEHGAALYLAGHTHGGQVRLPGRGPIFTHSRAPRAFAADRWEYRGMQGYTSSGVGVSGVPVRFNCPGEICIIILKKG